MAISHIAEIAETPALLRIYCSEGCFHDGNLQSFLQEYRIGFLYYAFPKVFSDAVCSVAGGGSTQGQVTPLLHHCITHTCSVTPLPHTHTQLWPWKQLHLKGRMVDFMSLSAYHCHPLWRWWKTTTLPQQGNGLCQPRLNYATGCFQAQFSEEMGNSCHVS